MNVRAFMENTKTQEIHTNTYCDSLINEISHLRLRSQNHNNHTNLHKNLQSKYHLSTCIFIFIYVSFGDEYN